LAVISFFVAREEPDGGEFARGRGGDGDARPLLFGEIFCRLLEGTGEGTGRLGGMVTAGEDYGSMRSLIFPKGRCDIVSVTTIAIKSTLQPI